ncbi:trehalase-like domain-containing protein [Nocardia beijingensis]|uniref:trehalase-like domain-containing protein n=1 Tax=Nocardia beijingensis TaxID=95162 RepID=UPI0033315764
MVSSAGTIDWWCTPRFDSPSIFASLLDGERGGHCGLAADVGTEEMAIRQLYLPDTAILVTRFMAPEGVGEVADFMVPVLDSAPTDRHRLVRVARVVRGSLPLTTCRPRFDYGRAAHTLERLGDRAAVFHGPGTDLHLQVAGPVPLRAPDASISVSVTIALFLTRERESHRSDSLAEPGSELHQINCRRSRRTPESPARWCYCRSQRTPVIVPRSLFFDWTRTP